MQFLQEEKEKDAQLLQLKRTVQVIVHKLLLKQSERAPPVPPPSDPSELDVSEPDVSEPDVSEPDVSEPVTSETQSFQPAASTSKTSTNIFHPAHSKVCPVCKKGFETQAKMNAHVTVEHPWYRYRCNECAKKFEKATAYKKHYRDIHCTKEHVCELCEMAFSYPGDLHTHMRTHTSKVHHKCSHRKCGSTFTTLKALHQHQLKHKGTEYPCTKCDFVTNHPQQLAQHERLHKPKSTCSCGFVYLWNSQLRNHRLTGCPDEE